MTAGKYGYKIDQLRNMLRIEQSPDAEIRGYGAHLSHWHEDTAPVNIDAGALEALIDYYERKNMEGLK